MSAISGARYLMGRYLLRRRFLDARVPELDAVLRVRSSDVAGRHLFKYGRYEVEWMRFLLEWLPSRSGGDERAAVLDVGANLGFYSVLAHRTAGPAVTIHAFEPDPDNFALLRHNVAHNADERIRTIRSAVSDEVGSRTLYRYPAKNLGKHSFTPFGDEDGEQVEVPTTTLDRWWQERNPAAERVLLLKIDVEGHEPAALRGAPEVLARTDAVLIEFHPGLARRCGTPEGAALQLLASAGFAPHELRDGELRRTDVAAILADRTPRNVLFTR